MGYIQNFAKAVSLSGKKKGRRPVMNAQQFYPRGLERELQQKTEAEFERILRELTEVALVGYSGNFDDDIGDLMNNPLDFSEEFKNAVDNIMKRTDVHAHANFSRQAELIIGAPYYPPGTAEGILNDWKSTFLSYCKSAGEQQKTKIATIVLEGKEKGWNKVQLEKEIMSRLDPQFQNRAELIARTELGKLNSRITLETYKSVGVEYYKWLTTIDGRERESHAELNDVICSVSDPDVYFEENEKNPLSPIQKMRTATMYHGHPGTDFQCRCSMVMWDPEIDGQYKVKESDYEERKAAEEAEKLAQEQAEAERIAQEQAEKEKAARELKEAKRLAEEAKKALEEAKKARIEAAAVKRHAERDADEIQKAWDERKAARAAAIKESQDIINQYGGITEFPTDEIKNYLANDQTKKALEAAKKLKSDVEAEVSKLNLLEDPLAVLKQWGAKNAEGVQNAVETKLASWNQLSPVEKKKKLEFEIDWLAKTKKYNTWEISQSAYKKYLTEVEYLINNPPVYGSKGIIQWSKTTYTKTAKNTALWGDGVHTSKQDVDNVMRPITEALWKKASLDEQMAATEYTMGSGGFNRPLRGYDGGWKPQHFKGVGYVPLDNEGMEKQINDLTSLIDRSTLKQNTWLSRGWESDDGAASFLHITTTELYNLKNLTQQELDAKFLNKEFTDHAFASCGSSKGSGFHGAMVGSIYCPKGTKAIYSEPFSHYNGDSLSLKNLWDGKTKYSLMGEFETLVQRGTTYKCKKVYFSGGQLYMDFDIVKQNKF